MHSEYIKIAVANILNETSQGIERSCGSCNPSCDDLTRFICFGHSMKEVQDWINTNPEKLHQQYSDNESKLYADYAEYMRQRQEEEKLSFAKKFCSTCSCFVAAKEKALSEHNSVFDAVIEVESFQKDCIKSCIKFNEAYLTHMEELTNEKDFSICV